MRQILEKCVEYGLQPALLAAVLFGWMVYGDNPLFYPAALVCVQLVLGLLERVFTARPDWQHPGLLKSKYVVIAIVLFVLSAPFAEFYDQALSTPLAAVRETLGLTFWPHEWPVIIQVLMVLSLSEFVWYWVHRAEHRFFFIWRATGHGSHHAFKRLEAINFGLNHPFELVVLVLPSAFIDLLFGVGAPAAAAAVLAATLASIAHTNIRLNSRVIGWFFTTNEYHIRHHSVVLEESNTNYGCALIVWDRLFGTFASGPTPETGTGPTEPTLWQMVLMPFKEPTDTKIAPG